LGVEKTVVEDVEFDEVAEVLVRRVRPATEPVPPRWLAPLRA
jgi:hypothetical protein